MKLDHLEDSLPSVESYEYDEFVNDLVEFKISMEDVYGLEGEYTEPFYDLGKSISKGIKSGINKIAKPVSKFLDNRKAKNAIIKVIEDKLREEPILDRLLSNDLIKVKLTKLDDEWLVKIKAKSDKKIKFYLVTHQLNRDGIAEFEEFKEMLKDRIPHLIRKAKKESNLNIANESLDSVLKAIEDLYGKEAVIKVCNELIK